uniref:Fibroin-like protein n=1 Tax=Oryza sativa subsp. japonica TaxID=39947 RepID=Q6Z2K4_ORYSJ|nr:fibroin-like protein [Oryza sativa Japonica Group]
MAAGPRAAARLAVDRAHGREDGGRGRLTGRRLDPVKRGRRLRWRQRGKGEEARRLIGRLTARGGIRRTAASRREMRAPAKGGGDGELIPWLGLERGDRTVAGCSDEVRRDADADERENGQRGAGLGLADAERNCDTHAVTRDPKVASDARAAALCGGRRRRHGTEAKEKAGGWGGGSGRVKGVQGGWRHEELTKGKPTAADFDGNRRRRGKRESGGVSLVLLRRTARATTGQGRQQGSDKGTANKIAQSGLALVAVVGRVNFGWSQLPCFDTVRTRVDEVSCDGTRLELNHSTATMDLELEVMRKGRRSPTW